MVNEELLREVVIIDSGGRRWPIIAEVRNGLALHHKVLISCNGVDFLTSKEWTITHVQSGVALCSYPNEQRARGQFAQVSEIRYHGILFGDLPGCELCANVLAICTLLKSRTGAERLLNNAAVIADALACARPEEAPHA